MFQTPVAALQQVQLPQHPLCPKLTLMACDTEDLTHQTFLSFLYTSEFRLFPKLKTISVLLKCLFLLKRK